MEFNDIAVNFFGILGIAGCMLCFHGKNMKNVIKIKFAADAAWIMHYLLLGAVNGCIANIICLCRETVFINKSKHKILQSKLWLLLFVLLNWLSLAFTWKGYFSLMPATTSTLATVGFWQKNITVTRVIGLINNCMMFTYSFCVGSYSGMINEVLTFVSITIALFIAFLGRKKNA